MFPHAKGAYAFLHLADPASEPRISQRDGGGTAFRRSGTTSTCPTAICGSCCTDSRPLLRSLTGASSSPEGLAFVSELLSEPSAPFQRFVPPPGGLQVRTPQLAVFFRKISIFSTAKVVYRSKKVRLIPAPRIKLCARYITVAPQRRPHLTEGAEFTAGEVR